MSRRVGSFSGFPRSTFESKDSITTSPPAIDTTPPGNASGRKGLPESEWARPDLDWRPPGYQPGAPTGLSYGPTEPSEIWGRIISFGNRRDPASSGPCTSRPVRFLHRVHRTEWMPCAGISPKALLSHFEIRRPRDKGVPRGHQVWEEREQVQADTQARTKNPGGVQRRPPRTLRGQPATLEV